MAAISPDLALDPKPKEAPFFHRLTRRIEEYAKLARLNAPISNGPISYTLDGSQYIVAAAGDTIWAFVR